MRSGIARLLRWVVALALAAGLASPLFAERPGDARDPAPRTRSGNYDLRPQDVIEIKVFQEDDLNSVLRISRDGTVNFPLIGTVRVGGRSPQGAAAAIRELLARDYLVNPQVSVTVRDFSKQRFTVLGEVQRPGAYELPDRDAIDLLEAIGMAGGYTRIAEPSRITLKRVVGGRETILKLDAKKMAREGDGRPVEVKPGDVITVGERIF